MSITFLLFFFPKYICFFYLNLIFFLLILLPFQIESTSKKDKMKSSLCENDKAASHSKRSHQHSGSSKHMLNHNVSNWWRFIIVINLLFYFKFFNQTEYSYFSFFFFIFLSHQFLFEKKKNSIKLVDIFKNKQKFFVFVFLYNKKKIFFSFLFVF